MSHTMDQENVLEDTEQFPIEATNPLHELPDQEMTESVEENYEDELEEISELQSAEVDSNLDDLNDLMAQTKSIFSHSTSNKFCRKGRTKTQKLRARPICPARYSSAPRAG